jgi:hypothetical protein
MTIDKIKTHISPEIYQHWTNIANMQDYQKAKYFLIRGRRMLQSEIERGILKDFKYHAELQLLNYLIN